MSLYEKNNGNDTSWTSKSSLGLIVVIVFVFGGFYLLSKDSTTRFGSIKQGGPCDEKDRCEGTMECRQGRCVSFK